MALLGLIGMQAVYWLVTHPVNKFWLEDEKLGSLGSGFFSFASTRGPGRPDRTRPADWTDLRDRWEYSHVVRAGFSALSLLALLVSLS